MRYAGRIGTVVAIVLVAALAGIGAAGCQRKVEVKSGTITKCTAGEIISNDVKTITVPANKAGAYSVRTLVITCDKHATLAKLYAEAQAAIVATDPKLAAAKLAEVLAIDPTYRKAAEQAASIAKGSKTPVDNAPPPSTTPTTTEPGTPDTPGEPPATGALSRWAPDAISGFTAGKLLADSLTISREYLPSGSSSASALVIVAEQFRTAGDAQAGLAKQVKQAYPKDAATLKVKGHDAYFGTDGKKFAVLAFTDGAVMVALELTTSSSPSKLRSLAEQVAGQLP